MDRGVYKFTPYDPVVVFLICKANEPKEHDRY